MVAFIVSFEPPVHSLVRGAGTFALGASGIDPGSDFAIPVGGDVVGIGYASGWSRLCQRFPARSGELPHISANVRMHDPVRSPALALELSKCYAQRFVSISRAWWNDRSEPAQFAVRKLGENCQPRCHKAARSRQV